MNEEKNMREEQKPAAVAVPVGATHYQPHQKAYYKRLSATEWQLWAESRKEWIPSPGTSDSAQWVTIQAIQAPQLPAAARPEQDDDADWEIRGKLAASLTCWHRLTGAEADELVGLAKSWSAPQPPAQAQEPPNLKCKSTQKRLATLWCFVPAEVQEPVATYMGHRLTPEKTKEFWGYSDRELPKGTLLYSHTATQQPAPAAQGDVDPLQGAANGLLEALERLSAQCTRLRLPGQPETDAEKTARAVIAKVTGGAA